MSQIEDIQKHRDIYELGKRAILYHLDTGLCVFCAADDCENEPHEDHCNVGTLSGVVVDEARKARKAMERGLVHDMIMG